MVGLRTKSPEQAAAESEPPAPSTVTATVEQRVLSDEVVFRGTITSVASYPVAVSGPEGLAPIVSATPLGLDATVDEGSTLVEIAGRPVIALQGPVPPYRDLRPGDDGPDVRQLQDALRRVGVYSGPSDGVVGEGTQHAISTLYERVHSQAPEHVPEGGSTLDGAIEVLDAARAALDQARQSGDAATVEAARAVLTDAERSYDEADRSTGPMLPRSEVVFVPALPAQVEDVTVSVGATLGEDPVMTLATGGLRIAGQANARDGDLVKVGQPVKVYPDDTTTVLDGTVASIGALTSTEASSGYPAVVQPAGEVAADLRGKGARIVVTVSTTDTSVLVVPLSAVYAGQNGTDRVLRVDDAAGSVAPAEAKAEVVEVDVGASADGYVAVTPLGGGLEAGDHVVVGR